MKKPARKPSGGKSKGRTRPAAQVAGTPGQGLFPIVGVGASAGGLEAFTELLKHLPADTGMGFVLVQHLDPEHESALVTLLGRTTRMPVREVTNNLRVAPNHVYIIPPNRCLSIAGGVLKLTPRNSARGPTRSVDFFFESLAQDQHERGIGVVLSGSASDGTIGLEAIKAEGGVTFAQDESAKYDSMPRSAISAGVVDLVLAPQKIAAELARIAKHPLVLGAAEEAAPELHSEQEREADQREGKDAPLASGGRGTPPTGARQAKLEAAATGRTTKPGDEDFKKVLLILRNHCGVDFSLYKSSTIQRRVARRMVLNQHETLASYAVFLKANSKERDALYSDVLISVTSFFRNPEAFDTLKRKVFPKLLAQRGRDEPLRIWTLGCSTGQEAYSIAMAFAEVSANKTHAEKLQVFATDLNEALLEKARHGLYAKSLVEDLSPERLRRFFVEEEGGWRVSKTLREQVVFARQNVISDPPFSHVDLISCRNLLIYLDGDLQKKIFPAFHYALKPGGFLFLGASESIGSFTNLFGAADKKQKIFVKKPTPTPTFRLPLPGALRVPAVPPGTRVAAPARVRGLSDGERGDLTAQREADRISVSQFAPPGVLVDAGGHVLQFRGATGAYLEPAAGRATFDVLKMARDGLMLPLRALLNKARREHKSVRREGVRVRQDGHARLVTVQVIPLLNLQEPRFLVLFEDAAAPRAARPSPAAPPAPAGKRESASRIAELERELAETRDYLQAIQEQTEAASEELQASSEELQSSNEEHQSVNEELETSKEELESTNEELTTINDEMVSRNAEMQRLVADLRNLQISIHTAILLLRRDLTIRRFTPLAEQIFNLLPTDIGRPFSGVRHNLQVPDLDQLLLEVLDSVSVREREVQDKHGHWFTLRARPYLTLDNKVDGVVVVLSDIDELKRSEHEAKVQRDYSEGILRAAPVPFLVLRGDLRVSTASESFYRRFNVTPGVTEGRLVYEIGNGQWNIPVLRALLEDIIPRDRVFNDYEMTHDFPDIGTRIVLLNARRLDNAEGTPNILLGITDITDITDVQQAQTALRESEERYRALFASVPVAVFVCDLDAVIQQHNPRAVELWGRAPECGVERHCGSVRLFLPDGSELPHQQSPIVEVLRTGVPALNVEVFIERPDGSRLPVLVNFAALKDVHGEITGAVTSFIDIAERKRVEEALRESESRKSAILDGALDAIITMDHEGKVVDFNPAAEAMFGLSREEIAGQHMAEKIIPERLREAHYRGLAHYLTSGEGPVLKKRIEVPALHADGHEFTIELSINRIPAVEPPMFTATLRDITERQRMAAAMCESEERFHALAENMAQLAWMADAEGFIFWYNQRWFDYTGTTLERMQGWGWKEVHHPEHLPRVEARWKAHLAAGTGFEDTFPLLGADGQYGWFLTRAVPIRDASGKVQRWFGTNTDVTAQREAADALATAKEQVEAASRAKDDFLAALSHELRTPLTPVLMTAASLETDPSLSEDMRDQLSMMRRNIELEARLIDDLLDLTRISRGKLSIAPVASDIHQLLDHTAEIIRSDGLGKQVRVVFVLDAGQHHALADPARIQQVFWNLIKNALKFTPSGGTITVSTRNDDERSIVVSVEDTGIGIAAEALPHIFKAFEQGDVTGQHRYGGLGLGLAISQAIVAVHGGIIRAESPGVGHGATFTVALATVAPPAAPSGGETSPTEPVRALRLLIVEDHEATRTVLTRLLTRSGHRVTAASTMRDALVCFAAERFDAVVSDLGLPDGSGLDLMRELQRRRPIPGIALSGYGMEDDLRQTKEAGFFAHLVKPVNIGQLRHLLAQIAAPKE